MPAAKLVGMTSWRSTASPQAQHDFDELLNAVVPFAEGQLRKGRRLFPFGAAVSVDGRTGLVAVGPETDDLDSYTALELLYAGARQRAENNRAFAFVVGVRTPNGDAVRIEAEHSEGQSLQMLIPYHRVKMRRNVQFGETHFSATQPRVWPG